MNSNSSTESLRRVFQQGFIVQDVAEPLISFDADAPASRVRSIMEAKRLEIAGIREQGLVVGFVHKSDLDDGDCIRLVRTFDPSLTVHASTQLGELILKLNDHRRLFVSILGSVGGIVSRSDMQKPPVRMWLFGIVTLIEMRFTKLIEEALPDGQWQTLLSEGRIRKAESLVAERGRRGHDVQLFDCLQLSDKATIVSRNPQLRERTQFDSRRQLESMAAKLESLRNNLAHAQDIVSDDWEVIVLLAESLDFVLERENGIVTRPLAGNVDELP